MKNGAPSGASFLFVGGRWASVLPPGVIVDKMAIPMALEAPFLVRYAAV
ncbi:hypothetical protein BJB45_16055 [Halomonas huangheensis]|uniref:Uncharacterized protein n=1 Tax=Halomonas huangheensis TaxID=1178482 RepID=W1NB62_9GAMM|nr:hypothetical protein BJB45_16055 [Halomonas huangheensis]